jgi:type II secretory pathway pseudopilin PulG
MSKQHRDEIGETLVEICIALVILGAVVSSFFAGFSTATKASSTHRDLVTADAALRDYAEATKTAVRAGCTGGSTYTVSYSPPAGFTVNPLAGQTCPSTTAVKQVDLTVTMPNGHTKPLSIFVRKP